MSFGGGREQYILEYLVKVTNQGGAGGLTQLNTGMKQLDTTTKQVTVSQQQLVTAQNKVQQAGLGMSKALKGMAFGFLGITTAGAEAVGMLSMYQSTQEGVQEAQDAVNAALKEGGKGSKDYKDAVQDLTKAQRWQRMTQRNLMLSLFDLVPFIVLSVNGMLKAKRASQELRTAQAELKVVQDALSKSNSGLAVTNEAVNASQLSFIKGSKGVVGAQEAVAAANLSTNGSLITMIPNLTKQRAEMAAGTSTMAKFKTGLIGAGASIGAFTKKLLPIAAIIGTIIIAVEAWVNNWGGFGDAINKAGVAIGNIHPWLKMLMEDLAKVGLTIDALIHGDFGKIKEIWFGAAKGIDTFSTSSDKARKAAEEWAKSLDDLSAAGNELILNAANAKKGERKDLLEMWGIKGGARKRFNDTLDSIKDFSNKVTGIFDSLKVQNQLVEWDKVFDIPDSVFKKSANTFASRLKTMADKMDGDIKYNFYELANIVKLDAKKGGKTVSQDIAKYLIDHPAFKAELEKLHLIDPETETLIQKQLKEARAKIDKIIADANNMRDTPRGEIGSEVDKKLNTRGVNVGQGPNGAGGIFGDLINQITQLPTQITTTLKNANWTEAGTQLRKSITSLINPANAQKVGSMARIYLVDPIAATFTGLGAAIQAATHGWVESFKKDPVGTIMGTLDKVTFAISSFVAGLLGYKSEQDMFTQWKNGLVLMFRNNETLMALRALVNDPIGGMISLLKGQLIGESARNIAAGDFNAHEAETFGRGGSGEGTTKGSVLDQILGPIIKNIQTEWDKFITNLGKNEIIQQIALFFSDPIGWILATIDKIKSQIKTITPAPTQNFIADKSIIDQSGFTKKLDELVKPIQDVVDKIHSVVDPLIQTIAGFNEAQRAIFEYAFGVGTKTFSDIVSLIMHQAFGEPTAGSSTVKTTPNGTNSITADIKVTATTTEAQSALGSVQISLNGIAASSQAMDSVVSKSLNSMTQTAQVDSGMVKDTFASSFGEIESLMDTLAHDWSTVMNSFINNAKAAANGVNSALAKIKNIDRTITFHIQTTGRAPSGSGLRFEKLAKGFHGMVDSPTLLLTGEAGPERVDVTPRGASSNTAIRASLNRSNSIPVIINNTFRLDGTDIINDRKMTKRIKFDVGRNRDKFR